MSIRNDLLRIAAEAIVRTAERPAGLRGPWIFNEAELQENAKAARAFLEQANERD